MQKKTCTGCGRKLPATTNYFHKRGGARPGLRARCIDCHNQYYQDNKEQIARKTRIYRRNNKEAIAQRKADYYQSHRDQSLERHRRWAEDNAERLREYQRNYTRQRKESKREYDKIYRKANRLRFMQSKKKRQDAARVGRH